MNLFSHHDLNNTHSKKKKGSSGVLCSGHGAI